MRERGADRNRDRERDRQTYRQTDRQKNEILIMITINMCVNRSVLTVGPNRPKIMDNLRGFWRFTDCRCPCVHFRFVKRPIIFRERAKWIIVGFDVGPTERCGTHRTRTVSRSTGDGKRSRGRIKNDPIVAAGGGVRTWRNRRGFGRDGLGRYGPSYPRDRPCLHGKRLCRNDGN